MPKKKSKKKAASKKISTKVLIQQALTFEKYRKQEKTHEKKRKAIQADVVEELKRRKVRSFTSDVVDDIPTTITVVQNDYVNYDPDQLWERLTPTQRKRVFKREVDPDKLAAEVQAGNVDMKDVEACSYLTHSSPYIRVTVGE